jgi:radical SAM superfamily enzyme YgiQ (UPF0313 family)
VDLLLIDPVTTAKSLPAVERRKLRQGIGYPALGLLTVAALTPSDVNVRVIDESVEDIDFDLSPDLVGITVQCPVAPYAYELASVYRRKGIPVVLGGVHVSLNQEEAQQNADAIVTGEAELTWPTLVEDFRKGRMKKVYAARSLADLDASPRPRRDLIKSENYQIPFVLQASKGCPFGCEFCSLYCYVGYHPRFRKVENVLREIREIPGDKVLFADDNLYANPSYTKALLSGLVSLQKRWVAETTWNIAFDNEILTLAKASGCVGLFMGFDSINQQNSMKKVPAHDTESTYIRAIQNVQSKGLAVVAAFVFGLDNDDSSVFERSLEVVLHGGANLVNFSALVPYPGTPIFKRLKDEGRITEWNWSRYISPNVCFTPKQMSAQELHEGTAWAQREFYSLRNIVKVSLKAFSKMGWGMSLLSMQLNLAQRRDWGKGSSDG